MHPLHDPAERGHAQADEKAQHPGENDERDLIVAELAAAEGADQRLETDADGAAAAIVERRRPRLCRIAPSERTGDAGREAGR